MKKLLEAMDTMASAEKKPTGPKFPGYLKGTDPASKARDKMVGGCEQESVIKELAKTAKDTSTERKLKEEFANFQGVAEGVSKQFEIIYYKSNGDRMRTVISGTSKSSVAKQFKKQHNLEIEQVKELKQGVAEGLADTQQKIVDTINKLENRLKHAKTPEQWDRISARIERLQAGLNRSKQGVAEDTEEVDTHGRTKAEWVKAVHAKYPMARVIYSKDNTQVMAVLPDGKEIRWIKDEGIIEQGIAEAGFTKTPSGDYINQHTGVRSSKPPVKKKRGEKTGAEWDAIEKAKKDKEQGVAEGSNNVGDTIRVLYQKIYDQGDDALEYLNTHAENFARYWDRFEGDLDSMIDELPPKILAKLAQELQIVAGQEGSNDLPQDTLDLIDEYIAKIEPSANRNKLIQDVIDGYIHTSELEYALQDNLSEETLDEKSVSKAQFRTMAAAAHNPKFAKKVGISSKVAKEFHKADKKSNYKSLPAKVDEDGKPDAITMDVPLMIRLFEYAREDAKTDMDLHDVAERLIKLSQEGRTLSMKDYDTICPSQEQSVAESSDVERKIHRTQALIQDYYNRSRNTSNDIKRDHYIDMARQLEYELEGMINDANRAEQDSYDVAQHDAEPSATWNRGGLAEGDVVQFPKKHKGDLENTHSCPKCGGDLQGGKYMGHQVKVCMPCKQVYLPPNSGIDQQGNPIKPVDEEQEAKYGDKYQAAVKRVGQKAKEQEKRKPVDIKALAARLAAMDKQVKQLKEVNVAPAVPTAPTAGGSPATQQQTQDQQDTVNMQKNLAKLKSVNPQLNPAMANQALHNISANPQAPVAGAQMAQTKNLADLVGDALADPQKGPQVATMLSQVQQAQKLKK